MKRAILSFDLVLLWRREKTRIKTIKLFCCVLAQISTRMSNKQAAEG